MRILGYLTIFVTLLTFNDEDAPKTTISTEELKLYDLIMEYRQSEGLGRIPLSNSLTLVAQTHCRDLVENSPDAKKNCNAHSWSAKGDWSSCCYTPDHKKAECMWHKPKELTSYDGYGFEIAVWSSQPNLTAAEALDSWKESVSHNNVIINRNKWKKVNWKAIGVGIYKGYATVWFGRETDLDGTPQQIP